MSLPISLAEHRRRGTYDARRHGHRIDDRVARGSPQKPDWVATDEAASWFWDVVTGGTTAGVLKAPDVVLLAGVAKWFSVWFQGASKPDLDYKGVMMMAASWKHIQTGLSKLGMSPVDRCRLRAVADGLAQETDDQASTDPKARFFGAG